MDIIGFVQGLPIYDGRAVVHDPTTGQFTSSGSGGSAARNKLMAGHASKHAASTHSYAAYLHEKAGNHEKAAEHKAKAAHHEKEAG